MRLWQTGKKCVAGVLAAAILTSSAVPAMAADVSTAETPAGVEDVTPTEAEPVETPAETPEETPSSEVTEEAEEVTEETAEEAEKATEETAEEAIAEVTQETTEQAPEVVTEEEAPAEETAEDAASLYTTDVVLIDTLPVPATPDVANTQPLSQSNAVFYGKTIEVNGASRNFKIYMAQGTPIRSYFTFVAVPDGTTDVKKFLDDNGWTAYADQMHEGIIALEPQSGSWGSAEDEQDYLNEAIKWYGGNSYFSVYGEHYFAGYGKGAAAMELWAAKNPLKVISQTYMDADDLNADALQEIGEQTFNGATANYNYVPDVEEDGFTQMRYDEIAIPTWFVSSTTTLPTASLNYWKNASDCEASGESNVFGTVYAQKSDSDLWVTDQAGAISKVATMTNASDMAAVSEQMRNFLYYYTRYENSFAYGNALSVRADNAALGIEFKHTTVNNKDREYSVYVPANSAEKFPDGAPVVFVFPGNTQTDRVFMDATQWWQVAQKEGFILVTVCEDYNTSTTVTHKDAGPFYEKIVEEMLADSKYNIDETRLYGTGQSLGSMTVQGFVESNPEYFAAVASTSGMRNAGTVQNEMVPNYLIYGRGDLAMLEGTLWDDTANTLDDWANYNLAVNGFELTNEKEDDFVVSGAHDRFHTWTWETEDNVETLKLSLNVYRSHNCISEEMPMLWDYMKNFSYELDTDGKVATRYYSPSAFTEADDQQVIYDRYAPVKLSKVTIPATDPAKGIL